MTSATTPITQNFVTLPRKLPDGPINLVGLTREALKEALITAGSPEKQVKMRLGQLWQWIYEKGVRDFEQMTNLSKDYRVFLAEHFVIAIPEVVSKQVSTDGTRKYLVRIAGGHEVETVYIPESIAAPSALAVKSAVPSPVHFATPARKNWCEISPQGKLLAR